MALRSNDYNRTAKNNDQSPEYADMLFAYGKALLENAIAQSAVLGKEQDEEKEDAEASSK
jgi:HAT1-interacting factor 1